MSAKGDGAIALEDTFGGRGRAVLTSSDAIETSSAPESGDDLSVYTRFLVEGIRTGAADRQQRGFVDAEDLHTYVSRRVAEAAPAMTPQFIPTREGHRIVVCKARRDPTVAYRQEVEKRAGERSGVISPAGRALLDDLKRELALPQPAAEAIEAEVLQPFRDYAEKLSRYQQALEALVAALPAPGAPLSPVDQEELALLEKRFKLRGSDVEALHRRLGIRFGEPEAAITTIDADPPPTSPSSEPQEGPSAGGGEVSFQQITTTHGWLEREGNSWQVKKDVVEVQGYREELAPGVALTMLRIPAGSFLMGSPANEPERASDEGPQHEVRLEEFYLSQTPITQAEWRVVAGWPKVELDLNPDPSNFKGSNRPVERVNWHEAMEFCRRLSDPTGRRYGLPSEAQWEYACRAGTTTPFHFGATLTAELANYDGTFLRFFGRYNGGPKGVNRKETTPVGTFPANPWGLQDVHGNVWEWCDDHWHDNYQGAPANGRSWLIPAAGSEEEKAAARRLLARHPQALPLGLPVRPPPGRPLQRLRFPRLLSPPRIIFLIPWSLKPLALWIFFEPADRGTINSISEHHRHGLRQRRQAPAARAFIPGIRLDRIHHVWSHPDAHPQPRRTADHPGQHRSDPLVRAPAQRPAPCPQIRPG